VTTQKLKQQLMKTTNVRKTMHNETEDWFRSAFMPTDQEFISGKMV